MTADVRRGASLVHSIDGTVWRMDLSNRKSDPDHPRPLLRRDWESLDGTWAFALDHDARLRRPEDVAFDREILVPFAPETPAGGVGDTGMYRACWYRRAFTPPPLAGGERLWVRFGAVDHEATVWVNGALVALHEGGSVPFGADVTEALRDGENDLVVRAFDDPLDLEKPRGKQDWRPHAHNIWYPRTSGIWQTVWLEVLPASALEALRLTPDLASWSFGVDARVDGPPRADLRVELTVRHRDRVLAEAAYAVDGGRARGRIALPDAGTTDDREELSWAPGNPVLFDVEARLTTPDGVLDEVSSYTAMRTVRVDRGRLLLNERPLQLRLVLDQGYWPETGLTPPDRTALERDVELTLALGFNGVRMHQKVEDERFLRIADERGLLVWGEMPSAYRFSTRATSRIVAEWQAVLERDAGHPCVIAWVPFNESWGVPDLPLVAAQRDLVRAVAHLTRAVDPTRPVVANDGWEVVGGDLVGIHDYAQDPATLAARLAPPPDELLERERPHGRALLLDGEARGERPVLLTEFGGIAYAAAEHQDDTWGYGRARSPEDLVDRYRELLAAVHGAGDLAGFCYTQLTDTYQEANGLLYADRTPKAPLEDLAAATRGEFPG